MPTFFNGWKELPMEMIQEIFRHLDYQDLRSCVQVCQHWRYSGIDDWVWKPKFENHYLWFKEPLTECSSYFEEFLFFKDNIPEKLALKIDDFEYNTLFCKFSPDGQYFLVVGQDAHFCLYRFDPIEFLHERTLEKSLKWRNIKNASFSPNSSMIMASGEKMDGTGEVAIFSICSETSEVHFVSRVASEPSFFNPCWFDDTHIIIGEHYTFNYTRIYSSISQFRLCSVERFTSESLLVPILRFLNKNDFVCAPLLSNCVSPRFRRIVQLSNEAKNEGKTLREKIDELGLNANIDEGNVKELKQILDKEHECYHCYLKHVLSESEYGGSIECQCVCHNNYQKLLIYCCERVSKRVCFKVIDQKLIADALAMTRFKKKPDDHDQETSNDLPANVFEQFDYQDYHIDFDGQIDSMTLSDDKKTLYVSIESIEYDFNNDDVGISHEVKVIDLEKMIIDPMGLRGRMKPKDKHYVAVNKSLVASFSTRKIYFWSKGHRGPYVKSLEIDSDISCVALHPTKNWLVITTDAKTLVYKP